MNELTSIQRLLPRHYKIIEFALAGHDTGFIAEALGMNPSSVGKVLSSPLVQHELARRRQSSQESTTLGEDRSAAVGKARSILELATEKAANVMEELLDSYDPNIKLRAADKILDRVFGKDSENRKTGAVNISAEQIQLLVVALKESDNENALPAADRPTGEGASVQGQGDVCQGTEA